MGPEADAPTPRAEQPRASRPRRRMPTGKLVAVALVSNLMLVAGGAAVFAPVESTRFALETYDGLPAWLRSALGDRGNASEAAESRSVGSDVDRGPVGGWLEDLHLAALEGDVDAQLAMPLDLMTDLPADTWTAAPAVNVSWLSFDSGFTYRVWTTPEGVEPDADGMEGQLTEADRVRVPLSPGRHVVHVQPIDGERRGPVSSKGLFLVDHSAPAAPRFVGDPTQVVDDYHFTFNWRPVTDDAPVIGYLIERSQNRGTTWEEVALVGPDATEHRERNKPNGVYVYTVRALNAAELFSPRDHTLEVTVDARANLQRPGHGSWHYGVNTTYDSVIHVWDISDPSPYLTRNELKANAEPPYGGLSATEFDLYTRAGWGVELANATLCGIAAAELGGACTWDADAERYRIVGGEQNTLRIGMILFEWLFDATDYDFAKFNDPAGQDFLKASQTLDRGQGICGDLTSLYITMMRMADVPARPVHGYLINGEDGIGGFHMWAEIYVGGDDPVGGGWMPVDVSGVTGSFEPSHLAIYFGVANPLYLQLGIQKDLGEPDLPADHARARWNVWANLQYTYFKSGSEAPTIGFDADARISERQATMGRIWFDPETLERAYCDGTQSCTGLKRHYYDQVRGRSVRAMDYGADLTFEDGSVEEIVLRLKFPEQPAPNQAVIYTTYYHTGDCWSRDSSPTETEDGFFEWIIEGHRAPCSR